MCRNLEAVADAQSVHADVQSSVCRRKIDDSEEHFCPYFHECGYQRQRRRKADLWFVAHELLFAQKPAGGRLA